MTTHLPYMALKQTYEAIASWLVRRGWRRERDWFYPPGGESPFSLEDAVAREATGAYIRQRRGRRMTLRTLLLLLATAAPAGAQDTATLTWHGTFRDVVAPGRSMSADGVNDCTFRVDLTGAAKTIQGLGIALANNEGGLWVTTGTSWIAGVADTVDGPLRNLANGELPAGFTTNRFYVFVPAGNSTRCQPGGIWVMTLYLADAVTTITTPPLTIPPTPEPIPAPQPSADEDHDTIPNGTDRCAGTPPGATVETSGAWIGCEPDTTGPAITVLHPTADPVRGAATIVVRAKDPSGVAGMLLYVLSWPGATAEELATVGTGLPMGVWVQQGPDGLIHLPIETRAGPVKGTYVFRADAIDRRGLRTTGATFSLVVDNSPTVVAAPPIPTPVPVPVVEIPAGNLIVLPTGTTPPAGYVQVGRIDGVGIIYRKQ